MLSSYDIAFGPDALMYASEAGGTGKVKRFDPSSGALVEVLFDSESDSAGPLELTYVAFLDEARFTVPEPSVFRLVLASAFAWILGSLRVVRLVAHALH